MAKPFSVSIVADAREFLREAGKIPDQLESIADGLEEMADKSDAEAKKAADSFEQIGDAADDAGKEVGDSLEDGAKNAATSLDHETRDMEKSIEKIGETADDTGKDLSDGIEDGAKDAEKAVDRQAGDMEKSLEKVGETATDTGKEIDTEITTGSDKASDSTESLADRARAALDRIRDKARDTGKSVDKEISDGADDAGEAMTELKDEASSVGREAATSFSGEFEDVTDIIRDIAAEAFIGFGPAAAAAGMAAAAGIGLIVEAINKSSERAELAQERYESMVEALSGPDAAEAFGEYVEGEMMKIVQGADDAIASMEDVEAWLEILGDTGITTADLLAALAGDSGAMERVQTAMDETGNVAEVMFKKMNGQDLSPTEQAIYDLNHVLTENETAADAAAEAAGYYKDATDQTKLPVEQATDRASALVDELREEHEIRLELAEANRSYAQVLADQDDELAAVNETITENNENISDATQLAIENTAALADLADGLIDEADAAAAAGIEGKELSSIQAQNYTDFLNTAKAAGLTAEEARDLARDFGLIPKQTKTDVTTAGIDRSKIKAIEMQNQLAKIERNVNINANLAMGNFGAQVRQQIARIGTVQIPAVAAIGRIIR